jgi:hypothetical protein
MTPLKAKLALRRAIGQTGFLIKPMSNKLEKAYGNRIGKRKRLELIVDSRAESLADEQRTNASQSIMLEEVIQDHMRPGYIRI